MILDKTEGKVAIYARVSTADKQDYTRQIDELKQVATSIGYQESEIEVYAENESGYNSQRPELLRLIASTEKNPRHYAYIFTHEVSRIGRKPSHSTSVIDRWTEQGIPLYIHSMRLCSLKDGKQDFIFGFLFKLLIEIGHWEAETFKMRSRSGLRRSASIGKAGGGAVMPYGYKKDGVGMLIVDDEEKVIVEKIFNMYSEGNGTKVIARILNNDNIPTKYHSLDKNPKRDKKWSDAVVLRIITNTIYKGERNFKGEKFNAPVIISKELFDKCDEIRKNKTRRNYMTKYTYLLKDKIHCGQCQRNYFARYKPQKNGDKVYVCSSKLTYQGHCGCPSLNISLIESILYYILKNTDSLHNYIKSSEDQIKHLTEQNEAFQKQNSGAKKQLVQYEAEQRKLLGAFLKVGTTITEDQFNQQNADSIRQIDNCKSLIERTDKEIQKNLKSIENLSSKKSKEEFLDKMKGDRNQLKNVFDEIFSRIIVTGFDEQSALVTVFIQINKVELSVPLQLLVNLHGMRRNPKKYQFKSDVDVNALEGNGTDELGEVWSTDNFNYLNWIDVPQEFILKMEQSE